MSPLLVPFATYRPIPSHGGAMRAQRGLVEHITTNDADPFGYFSNPAHQASSHLWISRDGLIEQFIDLRLQSWAQKAGNPFFTSVEVSGVTGTAKTPAQVEALARLFAWGHAHPELRWPLQLTSDPAVGGLGWHGMAASWGHPFCPGDARNAQRPAVLARAVALAGGAPAVHTPPAPEPAPKPAPAPAPVPEDIDMVIASYGPDKLLLLADGKVKHLAQSEYDGFVKAGLKEVPLAKDWFTRADYVPPAL